MKDWKGNTNSIYKTLGASNHTEEDREENDYYATDPIAIDKLIDVEQLNCTIWECACGENHLADRLRSRGFQVFASDIVKRKKDINQVQDFLKVGGGKFVLSRHSNKSTLQICKRVCFKGFRNSCTWL